MFHAGSARPALFALVAGVAVAVVIAGCSGGGAPTTAAAPSASSTPAVTLAPTATPAPSAVATPKPTQPSLPTVFTSPLYHYSVVLPGGWTAKPATVAWDGNYQYGHGEPENDSLIQTTSTRIVSVMAAPTKLGLAAYAADRIAATFRDHGDTCPAKPEVIEPTKVGGVDATFVAWNCGILINMTVVVDNGVGYVFGMRDPSIAGATDAAAREAFDSILSAVKLPD